MLHLFSLGFRILSLCFSFSESGPIQDISRLCENLSARSFDWIKQSRETCSGEGRWASLGLDTYHQEARHKPTNRQSQRTNGKLSSWLNSTYLEEKIKCNPAIHSIGITLLLSKLSMWQWPCDTKIPFKAIPNLQETRTTLRSCKVINVWIKR